jgi:DNA-binding NarL/FixJ family response regulator
MDLQLPVLGGVEATRQIAEAVPAARVLVLSASGEHSDVLDAVKAGATGYLVKSASADELRSAVERTAAGDPVFTAGLAGLVLGEFRRMTTGEAEVRLTERETEVLRLVAKGLTYKQIAERLVLSHRTVQNHVQNVLNKLQLHTRYELVRYAVKKGLDAEAE